MVNGERGGMEGGEKEGHQRGWLRGEEEETPTSFPLKVQTRWGQNCHCPTHKRTQTLEPFLH